MFYIYQFLTPRLALAIGMGSVLTADTAWIYAERDVDFLSRINPWVTLILSIIIFIWGIAPERYLYHLHEVLWFVHLWWLVLFVRLAFVPQPAQVDGFDRASWICVYLGMSVLALGLWFAARRKYSLCK